FIICFFFQAEDGIRDGHVTGVQTCALPISNDGAEAVTAEAVSSEIAKPRRLANRTARSSRSGSSSNRSAGLPTARMTPADRSRRSEERRVGKECRARWRADE